MMSMQLGVQEKFS